MLRLPAGKKAMSPARPALLAGLVGDEDLARDDVTVSSTV